MKMLGILKFYIFINISFVFVKCLIPSLSVQKLDRHIIKKKREDTLQMCRLFNAGNQIQYNPFAEEPHQQSKRSKRDTSNQIKLGNPVLDEESAKRVESIVDKLYEDLDEKVTYRQRNLPTTVKMEVLNNTMRRFNFAPQLLTLETTKVPIGIKDPKPPGVPWHKKWKHAIIPYFIDPKTYDAHLAETIVNAFDYFERATCIRLQRLRDKPNDQESMQNVEWLYITNPSGVRQCVHSNERKENRGVQKIVFGYDCLSLGQIVHEVMHILGFSHEHTRPDRDQYISILWNNIKPGYKRYFERRTKDQLLNIPYDYSSVLHYPARAFSKNGQVTIVGQVSHDVRLGQREGLSEADVEKVTYIFGHECIDRNKQYLLKTCPSVVNNNVPWRNVTKQHINEYFRDRLWPYGIVNYQIKDKVEFTTEERENIKSVIAHIEQETCIRFKDISEDDGEHENDFEYSGRDNKESDVVNSGKGSSDDVASLDDKDNTIDGGLKSGSESAVKSGSESGVKSGSESGSPNEAIKSDQENKPSSDNDENALRKGVQMKPKVKVRKIIRPADLKRGPAPGGKIGRRHAADILILTRGTEPGCTCPPPGKPSGNAVLKINADCFNSVNDLLHLFVHLLGLDHQHNMHDRDQYLHILWNKLTPEIKEEMKTKLPPAASVGFAYDYQSVMHYPWLQIKNGVTNMMYPVWNDGWAMGHWQGLSTVDVQKLNNLYFEQCLERKKQEDNQ